MEKIIKPISGLVGLVLILLMLAASVFLFLQLDEGEPPNGWILGSGIVLIALAIFLMKGMMVVQPNHSRVLNLFGKYAGTVKENGWFFVNPFLSTYNISLRSQNL